MSAYIYQNTLTHYGVLGMKWGVRKDKNRQTKNKVISDRREQLRSELNKKYKLEDEYSKADAEYTKDYKKLGYDPPDPEKYYRNADQLSRTVSKELDKAMRSEFGKDYDKFLSREQNMGAAVVGLGLTTSVALLYVGGKTVKFLSKKGMEVVKIGIEKILKG